MSDQENLEERAARLKKEYDQALQEREEILGQIRKSEEEFVELRAQKELLEKMLNEPEPPSLLDRFVGLFRRR